MKRLCFVMMVAGALLLVAASLAYAQDGNGDDTAAGDEAAIHGAAVYAEFCQACHGPQGAAVAPGPAFPAIEYDPDTARESIAAGVDSDPGDGVAMPPYAQANAGVLTDRQIDDLLAYMATWEGGDTPPLPEPHLTPIAPLTDYFGDGEPNAGAVVYAKNCLGCHGQEGVGRVPPNFPGFEVAGDALRVVGVVRADHPNPYMPAFSDAAGGPLSEQQIADLEAYIASWQVEEATAHHTADSKGIDNLLIVMGVAAVLLVAGTYVTRPESRKEIV